jgi:hypothetical protein
MNKYGRNESIQEDVKSFKPERLYFSYSEKKQNEQPQNSAKNQKDPACPFVGFH